MTTTRTFRVGLGVAAMAVASLVAWLTNSFPAPFYVGLFVVGPLAFGWFVIPAFVVPILVTKIPVDRQAMPKLLVLTLLALGASTAYLTRTNPYHGNRADELGMAALWLVGGVLTVLAAIGFLHPSRSLTVVYHVLLTTWFFALAFPYLGEFL